MCRTQAQGWDHVVPVSQGGPSTAGNIVPACQKCNSSKKDADVNDWMNRRDITPLPEFFDAVS